MAQLRRAGKFTVAKLASLFVDISILGIPIALKPGWKGSWAEIPGPYSLNLLGLWAVLIVGRWVNTQIRQGSRRVEWNVYWSKRADNLAGNIMEAAQLLYRKRKKGGREISSQRIVAGLLQQIVDVVEQLTDVPQNTTIQACLLVPVASGGKINALRAETYNKLTGGRRHAPIPLTSPGAVAVAYIENCVATVADTTVEPFRAEFEGRPYRCISAFPVDIGDGSGKDLVVVSVDVSAPFVLTPDVVKRLGIKDAISPFLSLIGLIQMGTNRLPGEIANDPDDGDGIA